MKKEEVRNGKERGMEPERGEIVEIERKDRIKKEEVRNRKVSLRSKTNAQ